MAEYTITIKDEEGGVSIQMAGPAAADSTANALTQGLLGMAPRLLAKVALQKLQECNCDKCKAERQAATPPNTTIH
ncbi:hypothetical protein NAV33_03095 [Pseudomonas stutzeri]|uniref:hypothetical protein n=1 Tax=Stutzerimonas stutzeri TaxID=316 RepID=UPI00210A6BDC|nr:hypothetical protein [Stutzerimonas stutzeri]MCQ4310889.1 hypothetical protein [Stutzerimonas stutzeri]